MKSLQFEFSRQSLGRRRFWQIFSEALCNGLHNRTNAGERRKKQGSEDFQQLICGSYLGQINCGAPRDARAQPAT
jgi:hypothetical protein